MTHRFLSSSDSEMGSQLLDQPEEVPIVTVVRNTKVVEVDPYPGPVTVDIEDAIENVRSGNPRVSSIYTNGSNELDASLIRSILRPF